MIVFLLQPGDELLLVWHAWLDDLVPTVIVNGDNIIEFSKYFLLHLQCLIPMKITNNNHEIINHRSRYTFLSKTDRPCKPYTKQDFIWCIAKEAQSVLYTSNITCMPRSMRKFLAMHDRELPDCTLGTKIIQISMQEKGIPPFIYMYFVSQSSNFEIEG